MPHVDGEVDEVVDLEQQLAIAEYEASQARGTLNERSTCLKVGRLKQQLAYMRRSNQLPTATTPDEGARQHIAGIPDNLRHGLMEMGATFYILCSGFVAYRLAGGGFLLMRQGSYDKVVYLCDDPFGCSAEALYAHWQAADPVAVV